MLRAPFDHGPCGEVPLLKRSQSPDSAAFREFVERLYGKVFSLCYALLGNAAEAEAATERVFARLYREGGPFASEGDQIQHLHRIAVDQYFADWRLRLERKLLAWFKKTASPPGRSRCPATDANGKQAFALHCLSALPERQRVLLVLREVAAQPVEDIAKIMHMEPGAVREGLFSARKRVLGVVLAGKKRAGLA